MRWPTPLNRRKNPLSYTPATEPRPLSDLPAGVRAIIHQLRCPWADAEHLRVLGVFEGARVGIISRRGGLLLDVRGSRLALDLAVAAAILAVPLAT